MLFRDHVRVGMITYFIAIVPIAVWVLYRQDWSFVELWRHWWELLICFLLCLIGAMAPDIDIKSRSQRIIYAILFLVDLMLVLFMYYREAAIIGLFAILPNVLKHRGQLHSPLAAVILPAPLLIIPILITGKLGYRQLGVSYYMAAMFGYVSHLVADRRERR